jgi:hypothetical protein
MLVTCETNSIDTNQVSGKQTISFSDNEAMFFLER